MVAFGRGEGGDGGKVVDALGHGARGLQVGVGQQDGELVAAQARRGVRGTAARLQHLADAPQRLVAGLVAVRIVEELEVDQVDQQDARRLAASAAARSSTVSRRLWKARWL